MKQLDKKAVWLFFFGLVARGLFVLVFIGMYFFISISNIIGGSSILFSPVWWFLIILIYLGICYIWAELTYRFYKYELTENGFRKESGILYKKYTTIPYERIQNIDINRGILAQLLGLSSLNIQTAGSSAIMGRNGFMSGVGAEGQLPGLSKEVANQVRDELIERAKKTSISNNI